MFSGKVKQTGISKRAKKKRARQRTEAQAAPQPAEYAHGTGKRIVPHRRVDSTPSVSSESSSDTHSSDQDSPNSSPSYSTGTLQDNEGSPPHCRLSPDESGEQKADSPPQSLNAIDP